MSESLRWINPGLVTFTDAIGGFSNAMVADASFTPDAVYHKHYSHVVFKDCNFVGVDFSTTSLVYCVFLCCHGIVDAGYDDRGYHFFGVRGKTKGYRIAAGCRWFTYQEALQHWTDKNNNDALARIMVIDTGFRRIADPDYGYTWEYSQTTME